MGIESKISLASTKSTASQQSGLETVLDCYQSFVTTGLHMLSSSTAAGSDSSSSYFVTHCYRYLSW